MRYTVNLTNITNIVPGDTIQLRNGNLATVCRNDIKRFGGTLSLFGDTYMLGMEPVSKAVIYRALP